MEGEGVNSNPALGGEGEASGRSPTLRGDAGPSLDDAPWPTRTVGNGLPSSSTDPRLAGGFWIGEGTGFRRGEALVGVERVRGGETAAIAVNAQRGR